MASKGDKSLAELSERFEVHANQISAWKQQLQAQAEVVFEGAAERRDTQTQPDVVTMQAKIGELTLENDFWLPEILVLDGVYGTAGGAPVFHPVRAPTAGELQTLLNRIIKRLLRLLTRQGYLVEEQGMTYLAEAAPESALTPLQAAACTYRIAFGPRAGQKVLTLQSVPNYPERLHRAERDCPRSSRVPPFIPLARMSWARLLKRVFDIDMEHCPHCGGT